MATKSPMVGDKRKSVSGGKGKFDAHAKKARLGSKSSKSSSDDKSIGSSSDSDEGGASLASAKFQKKPNNTQMPLFARTLEPGQTSREAHAKQKQLAQERKAAKPLADEVQRTKKIWERLRLKSHVPKDERQQLVTELFSIITGRIRDFVLKHDAVRAVQTAIKYSTSDQRKQIARELQGTYTQLAEGRYAKFLIGKLLVHNDNEIRDLVIPNFYGKVRKLINHTEASWILDDIYRTVATKEQKHILLREWFGLEFSLKEMTKDTKPTSSLKDIFQADPSRKGPVMKSLSELINTLVQKRMTGFTMLHDAMLEYFINTQSGTEDFTEFFELVKGDESGDLLKNLAFTRSGARLVCLLLAHGTSKDRKVILKAYKATITLMSGDQFAHLVILTAYDVIDDTRLSAKSIFPELVGEKDEEVAGNVVAAANNPYARITLLYLFSGIAKSLFPPSLEYDLEVLKEVHEIRKSTSKKDDEVRRNELASVLSEPLIKAITNSPSDLVVTAFGCQFVNDVLLSAVGDKEEPLTALAEVARGAPTEDTTDDSALTRPHISKTPFGGRMLKSLIQGGRFDKATGRVIPVSPPLNFSNILYPAIKDYVVDWATGPSSFAVLALLESSDFEQSDELSRLLKRNKKSLQDAATPRVKDELVVVGKEERGKKKTPGSPVGNMGSKLLLEKL